MFICKRAIDLAGRVIRSRSFAIHHRKITTAIDKQIDSSTISSTEQIRLPRRVRNHVNPFSKTHQAPFTIDKPWSDVFEDPTKKLHLDIGCAKGEYLDVIAAANSDWYEYGQRNAISGSHYCLLRNFIGLEIREDLVYKSRARISRLERPLRNLHFQYGNIMVADTFLAELPRSLDRVSILFPDPWYKRRHGKRRVVQHDNLNLIAKYMTHGSILYFATDVEDTWTDGIEVLSHNPHFELIPHRNWQTDFPDVLTSFHRSFLSKQIHSCAFKKK